MRLYNRKAARWLWRRMRRVRRIHRVAPPIASEAQNALFRLNGRRAPVLSAALFRSTRLWAIVVMHRRPDGYIVDLSPELAADIGGSGAGDRWALRDLDIPDSAPLFLTARGRWTLLDETPEGTGDPATDLGLAAFAVPPPWRIRSVSRSIETLLSLGVAPETIVTALYLEYLHRSADPIGSTHLSRRLLETPNGVGEALLQIISSDEMRQRGLELIERPGAAITRMVPLAGIFAPAPTAFENASVRIVGSQDGMIELDRDESGTFVVAILNVPMAGRWRLGLGLSGGGRVTASDPHAFGIETALTCSSKATDTGGILVTTDAPGRFVVEWTARLAAIGGEEADLPRARRMSVNVARHDEDVSTARVGQD